MIKVSIVGASGYTGGDLLLRKICRHKFVSAAEIEPCDVLFLGLPHGQMMNRLSEFEKIADTLIDLSADFRLNDNSAYEAWYGKPHSCPQKMDDFVYGIPELHRAAMKGAKRISGAGCNATATILALHPLYQAGSR
jgi:N-acetyl-gamma-glutamyl-phosphate/LysW-gamma-L-alpha-aminoadipyl-6-phosphate reductase